ncbi:hypothetical protein DTX80_17580 [Bacilli bacterium]|uniref:DUF7695 domain-containing protein n=1 Tax=Oceanobacillus sp. FSL K6-0118 TaxID=2921418 RepID=UPI00069C9443|nr:hypothetical protein DEJ64_15555 [Bacilli bacterium]PZD84466.1 hypothetical protein DEJ60_14635 [Bacilli bacterium]PZD86666.1 hypothetical protein DEJ66_15095 [Bacilli bacterium]RCO04346.1 hypothetical protein DTX80_17580 [Bacilli bacterium]RCO11098.1 hypothetical protein DTX79_00785 [Bacilli bacterium]
MLLIKILVNKVRCKKCDDIIESRHSHDFKVCKCGAIYIDGGTDYQKYGWGSPSNLGSSAEEYIDFSYSVYKK